MLRRRSLGGIFKFLVSKESLSYSYGLQKTTTEIEYGQIVGNYYVTQVTINDKTYNKLGGRGSGTSNIVYLNFKTTLPNQVITLDLLSSSASNNDYLGICKLDSGDYLTLEAKLSGTQNLTQNITVPTVGDHFLKIYYYQHNDDVIRDNNAGYFRLVPYNNVFNYEYENPTPINVKITSYKGWSITNKPDWITPSVMSWKAGNKIISVIASKNPGNYRSGQIIFQENNGESITVSVSQEANPSPNDIILTREKISAPQENTTTERISLNLIGNTSYSLSNIQSNISIENHPSINAIDITYTSNNSGYNSGFRITGDKGTVKDIVITEESLSCYCDCNEDLGCNCDTDRTWSQIDLIDDSYAQYCTSYSQQSCSNYTNCESDCPSHNSCQCNCKSVNTCDSKCSNCKCNTESVSTCPNHCNDTCNCYSVSSVCTVNCSDTCNCQNVSKTCSDCSDTCTCDNDSTCSKVTCICNTDSSCTGKCSNNPCYCEVVTSCSCECNIFSQSCSHCEHSTYECECKNVNNYCNECTCNKDETQDFDNESYCADCQCNTKSCTCNGENVTGCGCNTYHTCTGYNTANATCVCNTEYIITCLSDTCACDCNINDGI